MQSFLPAQATFEGLIGALTSLAKAVIPLLFILATVLFLWGVIKYLSAVGDESKISEAKKHILYGIIGLFFMVAVWGIVTAIVRSLFGT